MSDSKASSRKKKIIRSRYQQQQQGQKNDPGEKGSDSDWGFSEGEKGMAKVTKIALSLTFVLLMGFGYVVYQRMTKSEGFFNGSDENGQMKVAKVSGENEFRPGDGMGAVNSNVFGLGDSGESNTFLQQKPVVDAENDFFINDSDALGENGSTNGQLPAAFNQANSEYPYADRTETSQFDPFSENFGSSKGNEDIRDSDVSSETQNQFPNFDQERSLSQHNQSRELDGSGTGFDGGQASQQGAGQSPEVEMAGDGFSNSFDAAGDVRDVDSNQFSQQSEPQQVRYSENQQFLTKIPSQPEWNSEHESYGFKDQPAGVISAQSEQNGANQFSQSPQYPAESNSQTGQSDPNVGGSFGADVAKEDMYRPERESSIDRNDRFGPYQEPGFTRETASAKTTTAWREEPGKFSDRFDSSSRFSGASIKNQPGVYEVLSGDNYWSISKKQYGTARYFLALSRYNRQRIPDEKRMRPGMKVLTPSPEILQIQYPDLFPKRSAQSSRSQKSDSTTSKTSQPSGFFRGRSREPLYRVGEQDTLSGIAQKHLGRSSRWIQIYELNRSRLPSPNNLTIGTVLQLPADASNVRLVKNPQRDR